MSHPQSYEILLVPEFAGGGETGGADGPGRAIRSAVVAATGDTGASGYPRYAGEGVEADIDPATHTVEALLVDGAELDYGLSVRVSERAPGRPGPATDILPGAADRAEAAAAATTPTTAGGGAPDKDSRTGVHSPGALDRTETPGAETPVEQADGTSTGTDGSTGTDPGGSGPAR